MVCTPKGGVSSWSKDESPISPKLIMRRMDSMDSCVRSASLSAKTYKMRDEWQKHSQLFYESLDEMVSAKSMNRTNSFTMCASVGGKGGGRLSEMSGMFPANYQYMMHPACKKR